MEFQEIDIVTDHGSYKGDPAKIAFGKANDNFRELFGSAGLSNLLINPSMNFNQRAFAGGALAGNAFGYDRWFAASGGANVTFSGGVINHTSGTICQAIESPQNTLGTTVAVSVGDLSGGNLNVTAGGVAGTITPGAGRRSVNILVPSSTSGGHVVVTLSGTGITYRDVMVLRAEQAGRFDARPMPLELSLCQRYYESSFEDGIAPALGASSGLSMQSTGYTPGRVRLAFVPFKVRKRATPAMIAFTDSLASTQRAGGFAIYNGSSYPSAAMSWTDVSQTGCGGFLDYGSGITVGQSYWTRGNWTADADFRG
ncbi:hypothetical protein [Stenotrophomonas maltophilia]|uniref:hypothetical protein n=1 Tax=Stenotrophomonas maltophilia TaxID=40324 RepID=UPI0007EF44E6|nr:hypothetical protein [Stenotrophomonas maltophilia]OBU55127.1 hypothetical protein A9K69_01500 [Stenotrophomonas maltophilia]